MSLSYTVGQTIMLYNYHLHGISQINHINTVTERLIITCCVCADEAQLPNSNVLSFAITTL